MSGAGTIQFLAQAFLERHFGGEWRRAQFEPVEASTNFVARIELNGQRYALRVPRVADAVTGVDRHSEDCIMQVAARAGIAPEVVAHDANGGVLITRWVDGEIWSREKARTTPALVGIATTLRGLHGLAPPVGARRVSVDRVIEGYLASLRGVTDAAAQACRSLQAEATERLARLPRSTPVLCHNDAHHRNIVEAQRIILLDWEYAGLGDALFDLAGYASYHDLDDGGATALLEAYGADAVAARSFGDWRWLFEYIWALWLLATAPPESQDLPTFQRLLSRLQ